MKNNYSVNDEFEDKNLLNKRWGDAVCSAVASIIANTDNSVDTCQYLQAVTSIMASIANHFGTERKVLVLGDKDDSNQETQYMSSKLELFEKIKINTTGVVLVVGASGAGKTSFILSMAINFAVSNADKKIMYLSFEEDYTTINPRANHYICYQGYDNPKNLFFEHQNYSPYIVEDCLQKYDVVFLDHVSKLTAINHGENSSGSFTTLDNLLLKYKNKLIVCAVQAKLKGRDKNTIPYPEDIFNDSTLLQTSTTMFGIMRTVHCPPFSKERNNGYLIGVRKRRNCDADLLFKRLFLQHAIQNTKKYKHATAMLDGWCMSFDIERSLSASLEKCKTEFDGLWMVDKFVADANLRAVIQK